MSPVNFAKKLRSLKCAVVSCVMSNYPCSLAMFSENFVTIFENCVKLQRFRLGQVGRLLFFGTSYI